jgi:hypothetical protein
MPEMQISVSSNQIGIESRTRMNEEYTLKIDKNFEDMAFIVAPDGRVITTGSQIATSRVMVNLLNTELAAKNALIAEQAAEIAALKDENTRLLLGLVSAGNSLSDFTRRFEMENERANGQAGVIVRLKENNESLLYAVQETLKFFRSERVADVTTMRIFLEQFETTQSPAPLAPEAPATDEPEGYMRPCYRCCGTGTVKADRLTSYLIPCPICDGTGIHEDEE